MAGQAVLAGDIGGTKVRLGLYDAASMATLREATLASRDHADLESACRAFLRDAGLSPAAAAFGIAGPIVEGRTQTTNLPWVIERSSLERLLGCPVAMLNDLESTGHGVAALKPSEICVLNEGDEVARAPRALIAAGTGLGQGYMVYDAAHGHYAPAASEGGHSDFAPRDEIGIDLWRALAARHGHVSVERVVSGMGIVTILEHLAASGRHAVSAALRDEMAAGDPAAVISRGAVQEEDPLCEETMNRFITAYGAEAGNLALKTMCLGGLYVGGGIAPRVLPLMLGGRFMEAFTDKGRFAALMRRIPVRIILNDKASLMGAALVAARMVRTDAKETA